MGPLVAFSLYLEVWLKHIYFLNLKDCLASWTLAESVGRQPWERCPVPQPRDSSLRARCPACPLQAAAAVPPRAAALGSAASSDAAARGNWGKPHALGLPCSVIYHLASCLSCQSLLGCLCSFAVVTAPLEPFICLVHILGEVAKLK